MIDTEKINKMCRIYNRQAKCNGCPLAQRPMRCNVTIGNKEDLEEVAKLVNGWEMPTNGKRFVEVFGEEAFKRLCHESDFATWAGEI